jgi:hypothetical protein
MQSTRLFLTKDQVLFAGMTLAIAVEGKEEPETDGEGNPLVVTTLIGGISRLDLRCYPLDLMYVHPGGEPSPLNGKPMGGSIRAQSFVPSDVLPHVRFMPTEVFAPGDAPFDREFAVFADGQFIKYDGSTYCVRTIKDKDGRFLSVGYAPGWRKEDHQPYPLPDGAKLVPISTGASFAGLAATHPAVATTSPS